MKVFDRGSSVVIEIEFREYEPFGTSELVDPETASVSIFDKSGEVVEADAQLIQKDTGRWYYIIQTGEDWQVGRYFVKVFADYSGHSDVDVMNPAFCLR